MELVEQAGEGRSATVALISVSIPFFPLPIMKFAAVLRTMFAPAADTVRSVLIVLLVTGPEGAAKDRDVLSHERSGNDDRGRARGAEDADPPPGWSWPGRGCAPSWLCVPRRTNATAGPMSTTTVPLAR